MSRSGCPRYLHSIALKGHNRVAQGNASLNYELRIKIHPSADRLCGGLRLLRPLGTRNDNCKDWIPAYAGMTRRLLRHPPVGGFLAMTQWSNKS
jgi:hypothetical protein